ncbi:MAG: pimeloyl-ACP methyl ester esterase BioH [bacterium]
MRLEVDVSGSGPDLVMIHGWGMNHRVWQNAMPLLRERYRVHAVDLPGHGNSLLDGDHCTLEDWARQVLDVVPESATWLGWSLGAQIALQAALLEPTRVTGLLLVSGTPKYVADEQWTTALPGDQLQSFYTTLEADPLKTLLGFLTVQIPAGKQASSLLKRLRQSMFEVSVPQRKALAAGLDILRTTDLRTQLAALKCPRLWILGGRDRLVPVALEENLKHLDPESKVAVIDRAGHAPFLSHPEECLQLMERI